MVHLRLPRGATVAAPLSGLQLGTGRSGSMALRLFRTAGTRVVLAARPAPAQLLAVRAAAAGIPVQVVTSRSQLWEPLLRDPGQQGRSALGPHVVATTEMRQAPGGPSLLIDDRPAEPRGPGEPRAWQCRLEVRTQWTPAELGSYAYTDIVIFGAIPAEYTRNVAAVFGIGARAAEPLARLDARSFGIVRRGRVEYVSLDPSPAEGQLLEQARGVAAVAATNRR